MTASLEAVLKQMEGDQKTHSKSSKSSANSKALREARSRFRMLVKQNLTSPTEPPRIVNLIDENKWEMGRVKDEFVRANLRLVLSIARDNPRSIVMPCNPE